MLSEMNITKTEHGLRMSQHGVVITELRTSSGPTHSVADVLAALIKVLKPEGRIGVLGFAGGGMQAPLCALGVETKVEAVDLDRTGWDLFRWHCPKWVRRVNWKKADAVKWLRVHPADFDLLVEDLSVPEGGDVFKPPITWDVLPPLMRDRLARGGIAVFNLMPPAGGVWLSEVRRIARIFGKARIVSFDDFTNRILVAGKSLPPVRELGAVLRAALRMIGSCQAERIHLRTV
jgi:spermidine synthase